MKKTLHLFLIVCVLLSINKLSAQSFGVGAPTNDYTLTCSNSVITMTAYSFNVPYTYTWTSSSGTFTGNYINVTTPGNWACTGTNLTNSITTQQTFTIYSNIQQPTVVITPTVNNITCAGGSGCFTMTSNLGPNVTTNWYFMNGNTKVYTGAPQGTINIFCATHPGVFWGESVNNLTGCASIKSVQVTASVGVPIFSVSSSSNFMIGCSSNSVTSMQITTVITSPIPNVSTTHTLMVPPVTSTPSSFNTASVFPNITIPGVYVLWVKDQTNNCVSAQSITVLQNTVGPNVYFMGSSSILSCKEPSMSLTAMSNNTNTSYSWTAPPSSVAAGQTLQVNINPAVFNTTNNITAVGVYTAVVTDNNSLCKSDFTVQVVQDIRLPKFLITQQSNSLITCSSPSVTLVPVIAATLAVALVPTYTWYPPFIGTFTGTSYVTTTAGTHTAISMSAVNGCTFSATYNVGVDNTIGATGGWVNVACPITTAIVSPTFITSPTNLTFTWTGPSIISSVNQPTIAVTSIGIYTCVITNTAISGCTFTIYCQVVCANGIMSQTWSSTDISVFPNPSNGILTIEMSLLNNDTKISILDLQGKLVLEKPINEVKNKVYTNLPKGCYFYKIYQGNTLLKRDKLLVE